MTFKLLDRARMSVSGSPGTGNISLGVATTGYQTFFQAGVVDGDEFPYIIMDGTAWEYGIATYIFAGNQLSRNVTKTSAQTSAPLSLSNKAIVTACVRAEDIAENTTLAGLTDVNITPGSAIDGEVVYWDNAAGRFQTKTVSGGGGGSSTLAGLTDVNVTEGAPIDGWTLNWHNATSKWIAVAPVTPTAYSLEIDNNGTSVETAATKLNFVNATSITTSSGDVTITLPTGGGGGGSSLAILNNGTSVDTAAVSLNIINATSITTSSHAVTLTLPTGGGGGGGGVVQSHRYWRMRGVQYGATHSGWGASLCSMKDAGGTVLSTGGTPYASDTLSGASWSPSAAFDGASGSSHGWFSGEGSSAGLSDDQLGAWLAYDFGTAVSVASVQLACITSFSWTTPRQFAVDFSDDGVTWTQVNIFKTATAVDATPQSFTLSFAAVSGPPSGTVTIVQSASAAAYQGAATATLGATPTVGNMLLFVIGGHSDPYTLPSGVQVLDDYGYNGLSIKLTDSARSNQRILIASRIVQSGDGTSWAVTNSADSVSITVYELHNAGYVEVKGRLYYENATSTDTIFAPGCCPMFGTALCIGVHEDDGDAYTGGGSVGSGWTLDYNAVVSGHGHAVVTQHRTSGAGVPVTPQVTWHAGATNQPSAQASVTINPLT